MTRRLIDNGNKTYGVVVDRLRGGYAHMFWESVVDICKQKGHNLILLPGSSLDNRRPYDYQDNLIYEFIDKRHIDGLLVLSNTITTNETTQKIDRDILKDSSIPSISISLVYDKANATIFCDNAYGIDLAMAHLVEVHGAKRIGFIKGMNGHKDAIERFISYKKCLDRYNLPYDENIVMQGDFLIPSGRAAVHELLDLRNEKVDAIVAANDEMAIGAIEALEERGYSIPGDMRVVGFDNMMEVQFNMSPLATVEQPIKEMASLAIDLLGRLIRGEEIHNTYTVAPTYIPRASCGCLTGSLSLFDNNFELDGSKDVLAKHHKDMMMTFIQNSQFSELRAWRSYEEIIGTLSANPVTHQMCNDLLIQFGQLHESGKMRQNKVEFWRELLGYSRNYVLSHDHDSDSVQWIESFFIQARNRVYEQNLSDEGFKRIQQEENVDELMSELVHELILTRSIDELMNRLTVVFPQLLVKSCYVGLYDNVMEAPVYIDKSKPQLPNQSKLIMAYNEEGIVTCSDQCFETIDILPESIRMREEPMVMVINSLYFRDEAYGYIVFELGIRNGGAYEAVRRQLCSAITFLKMMSEEQQRSQELNEALQVLKDTQNQLVQTEKMVALGTLVAGMAHEINTPVGVAVSAASLLERKSKELLAAYETGKMRKSSFEKYIDVNIETSKIMLTNLQKAAELIKSFKNVSADQSSEEKRIFNVKDYIWQILISLRPKLKKTFVNVIVNADENIEINSYPGALSQIITNLVLNSLYHAYEKDEEGTMMITVKLMNKELCIEFSDDGKGMDQGVLSRIFDPFFTTARGRGGTGLGLHVVYNIVHQTFNGTIVCESEVGIGTKFVIQYPVLIDE